jgi:hypothetical protein
MFSVLIVLKTLLLEKRKKKKGLELWVPLTPQAKKSYQKFAQKEAKKSTQ